MDWQQYFIQGIEMIFLGLGTYFDLKDRQIPILFFWSFGVLGIAINVIWKYQKLENALFGICIGGLFLLIGWMTKESIGYGDGFGIAVLGMYEGWRRTFLIIFGAFLICGIYGIWKMIGLKESRDSEIPFYPFLLLGMLGVSLL